MGVPACATVGQGDVTGVFCPALGFRAVEDGGHVMKSGRGLRGREHGTVLATGHLSGLSFLITDAEGGGWIPAYWLPLASPTQIPKVGGHRLVDGGQSLHFPRIQEGDSGLYSCRAENQAGTAQRDFRLLVLSE